MSIEITNEKVQEVYQRLKKAVESKGHFLNPDVEFTKELIHSLLVNQHRYGYWLCPCRLASGDRQEDKDIICPCMYRDADVEEFGCCFCALYVSQDVALGKKPLASIPERRPADPQKRPQHQ